MHCPIYESSLNSSNPSMTIYLYWDICNSKIQLSSRGYHLMSYDKAFNVTLDLTLQTKKLATKHTFKGIGGLCVSS